jgi:hypothetical protein
MAAKMHFHVCRWAQARSVPFFVTTNHDVGVAPFVETPRRRRKSASNALNALQAGSPTSSEGSRTPPMDMPPVPMTFVDRDLETQVYTHQLHEKDWAMWHRLQRAGHKVLSPEDEDLVRQKLAKCEAESSAPEMFEMEL